MRAVEAALGGARLVIDNGGGYDPVLSQTLALFSNHVVKLLAYNKQTTGPETTAVLTAAKDNDIAIVPVTETLPADKTSLTWMAGNLATIWRALR